MSSSGQGEPLKGVQWCRFEEQRLKGKEIPQVGGREVMGLSIRNENEANKMRPTKRKRELRIMLEMMLENLATETYWNPEFQRQ